MENSDNLKSYTKKLERKIDSAMYEMFKYKRIFEDSLDLKLIINGDNGIIEETSNMVFEITGFNKDDVIGKPYSELLVKQDATNMAEYIDHVKMYGSVVSSRLLYKKDGSSIPVDMTINTLSSNGKNLIVVTIRDITERYNAEEKISRANAELKKLNASKDKFFSIIAHDLKNLFGSLIGFSDLLNAEFKELEESEKEFFVEQIFKISKNSYELLDNLLSWSQSQSGRLEYNPEFLSIIDLIEEVKTLMSVPASKKNIKLTLECPDNLKIKADSNMIKTVLRNLLSNSIKYTPENGEIMIHCQDKRTNAEISVIDNGCGMTREKLSTLFNIEKVSQINDNDAKKGTGLGLVLCKEFVECNEGHIWAESTPGKGSIFTFTLPMH